MISELWAYDEPHESGGNCHVTMTREQAVAMQRRRYPYETDDAAFNDWQSVNWAYPVSDTIPRATAAAAAFTRQVGCGLARDVEGEMTHRIKQYKEMPEWLPGCALIVVVICLAALIMLLSEG